MLRCRPFSCHAWVPPLSTTALTHNARRAPLSGWSGLIGHKKWLAGSRLNRQHRQLRAARYPVSGQVRPALCSTKICCRLACRSGQHRSKGVNTLDLEVGGFGAVRGRPPSARLRIHLPTLILSCGPRWGRSTPDEGKPWLRRGTPVVVQTHRAQVGPLINGGSEPWLSWLDLHRCDRDAAWPTLFSQLCAGRCVPAHQSIPKAR